MDKIKILEANVDFYKTWFTTFLAALIVSAIGYYTFYQKNPIAQTLFLWISIIFAITCLIFLMAYIFRYKDLIYELLK